MEPQKGLRSAAEKPRRKTKKIILAGAAAVLCLLALLFGIFFGPQGWERLFRTAGLGDIASQADGSPFLFHVLDVGKADALLLEFEGHFMLVDGGTVDQGVNVCRYLEKNRITYLDYVVNTHPDKDLYRRAGGCAGGGCRRDVFVAAPAGGIPA